MPRYRLIDGVMTAMPLPHELDFGPSVWTPPVVIPETFGDHTVSPRETRDAQFEAHLKHTDGSHAARDYCREKADNACRNWDRGVAEGSIQKH
jgi:hypothetical protein